MKSALSMLILLALASGVATAQVCKPMTIAGNWGVTCSGMMTPGPGAPLAPVQALGTCTTTHDAKTTCEATLSIGGGIVNATMVGTAVVNTDCTTTIKYTQTIEGQPAPDLNIRGLILDNGKIIKGLPVDPGTNMSCTLYRM